MFFTKYTLFAEKNVFIWKKKFIEKNINENVKKYISFQKYIFTQKMFVLQTKYKPFLGYLFSVTLKAEDLQHN